MKLDYKRTFFVGLAFFAICAFWQLYDHIIPLILKNSFGIGDTLAGGIMALDNVLALFLLPLFGSLSDRVSTPLGRRMPFILFGSIGACLAMQLIPLADRLRSLPLLVAGLGLTLLFMASYRSPAVALMPDVTPRPLRSKGNAVINLMGALGGILVLGLISLLLPKQMDGGAYRPGYTIIFLLCAAIMLVSTLVLLRTVKEPRLAAAMREESRRMGVPEQEPGERAGAPGEAPALLSPPVRRSMLFLLASVALWFMGYNAITTSFSKYYAERFGIAAGGSALILMIANAAAIVSYLPVGMLATKIGRRRCILGGVALLAAAFGAGSFLDSFSPVFYLLFILAGVAWAAINVNSYPMVVEMAQGADVGRFTGYYYTASMSAQILTPVLSGAALQFIGYETLFPYGALFVALSFVSMLFVRHGDAKPSAPGSKLESFEAMD